MKQAFATLRRLLDRAHIWLIQPIKLPVVEGPVVKDITIAGKPIELAPTESFSLSGSTT